MGSNSVIFILPPFSIENLLPLEEIILPLIFMTYLSLLSILFFIEKIGINENSGFPSGLLNKSPKDSQCKGVIDYDSGACCLKEVKTTAKILIILAF